MPAMTSNEAWRCFGEPFYLDIMNGFPSDSTEDYRSVADLEQRMDQAAPQVTDLVVRAMWNTGWREALMASWWAGICRFPDLDAGRAIQSVLSLSFPWYGYDGFVHFAGLALLEGEAAQEVVAWALEGVEYQGVDLYPRCAALLLEMQPFDEFTEEEELTVHRFVSLVKLGRRVRAGSLALR